MIVIAGDSWGEGYYQMNTQGDKWPGFHHYWKKSQTIYSYEMPYGHITQVDRITDINLKSRLIDYITPKHNYLTTPNRHFPGGHPAAEQYQKIYQFLK